MPETYCTVLHQQDSGTNTFFECSCSRSDAFVEQPQLSLRRHNRNELHHTTSSRCQTCESSEQSIANRYRDARIRREGVPKLERRGPDPEALGPGRHHQHRIPAVLGDAQERRTALTMN